MESQDRDGKRVSNEEPERILAVPKNQLPSDASPDLLANTIADGSKRWVRNGVEFRPRFFGRFFESGQTVHPIFFVSCGCGRRKSNAVPSRTSRRARS